MYQYPEQPFYHKDDPKFGNSFPELTDTEWKALQESHNRKLSLMRERDKNTYFLE